MKKFEFHPLLKQVPMMPLHERDALANDISENGQQFPIVLFGGKIIDGRNRYLACLSRDIEPKVIELNGQDAKSFIASANYFRKHWSTAERSHFAALMTLDSERGNPETKTATPLNTSNDVFTEKQAAEIMNVSVPSVQRAKAKLRGKKAKPRRKKNDEGRAVDKIGFLVPPESLPYWERRQEILDIQHHISSARCALEKVPDGDPFYWYVKLQGVIGELNSSYNQLAGVLPDYVCWSCDGINVDKCTVCKGTGVLSEFHWKKAPKEKKEAHENASTRPF